MSLFSFHKTSSNSILNASELNVDERVAACFKSFNGPRLKFSAGIAAMVGVAGSALVQPVVAQSNSAVLEEVVVTAQRREQSLQDVPLTVNALSSDQLDKAGITNIFDLQNAVSGLTFGGVGNLSQPAIRGVSTGVSTNGSENPNALYVDDVYFSQGNLLGANLPDVDRLEVLKGPQGTLFGRNSLGGAIRVFTKNPTFEPSGQFTVEAGQYTGDGGSASSPHTAVRGFVSTPLVDDVLAVSFSGGYDATDGWLTNDAAGEDYGTVSRSNARVKLLYQPSESFDVLVSAFYLKHNDEGLQSMTPVDGLVVSSEYEGSVVPSEPFHTAFDSGLGHEWNDALVKMSGASVKLTYDWQGLGTLSAISAYHDTEVFNQTTLTHTASSFDCLITFACIDFTYLATNKAVSQEINFSSEQVGIFSYTTGVFYYNQKSGTDTAIQETVIPGGLPARSTRFDITSYAIYGEMQAEPTDWFTLVLGARYTREPHDDTLLAPEFINRKETFTSFIPRLSFLFTLSDEVNTYFTYSEGEKSGLSGVDNGAGDPPYQSVDPEENTAYELGIKYASPAFTASLAGFYYDYKNKQEQGFTGDAVFVQNTGQVSVWGLDIESSLAVTDTVTLRANATWVPVAEYDEFEDAAVYGLVRNANGSFTQLQVDASGERLIRSPEFSGNLSVDYENFTDGGVIDASSTLSYSTKVYHDVNHVIEQPDYVTWSARAGYTFAESGLRLGVFGRNLTNEDYIAHGFSSSQGFTAAYARPRELGVSADWSF